MNYHIGRLVLSSLCVGAFGAGGFGGARFAATPNLQHTTNIEQDDRCGNSTTQSKAPEDCYINV